LLQRGDRISEPFAAVHESVFGALLTKHVEILAHHAVRGRLPDKAVRYLREAGIKAVARSANREAIEFFAAALEALKTLPSSDETLGIELDTCIKMGPALIAMKGAGSSEVETVYLRARDLVEQVGDSTQRFPALWGLWFVNFTRGQYEAARMSGARLLDAARVDNSWKRTMPCGQP
jgi:hypothetical protein